jgi:hypothetical protein
MPLVLLSLVHGACAMYSFKQRLLLVSADAACCFDAHLQGYVQVLLLPHILHEGICIHRACCCSCSRVSACCCDHLTDIVSWEGLDDNSCPVALRPAAALRVSEPVCWPAFYRVNAHALIGCALAGADAAAAVISVCVCVVEVHSYTLLHNNALTKHLAALQGAGMQVNSRHHVQVVSCCSVGMRAYQNTAGVLKCC